ncbi:MAG: ABC transporter ATP-binding protein [Bacteroidota bacterium]|nr:ABC transporter ATP-binding protein [Bacteroidota bacterium]
MAELSLRSISKSFGQLQAIAPLDLEIHSGDFFSLLGPSGCGKTTLLRIIAGLEQPSGGSLFLNQEDITKLLPQKRNIGLVFQNYALFPHMTVFQNVAYGLEVLRQSKNEIRKKVESVLEKVRLNGKRDVRVPNLSGGEQQRVALARALVVEPRVLLFDEPLSNLDHALRLETRGVIKQLQKEAGITSIYVTHDQGEALAISDRIAVMDRGIILQTGTPEELYFSPANRFVASFVGRANFFTAEICKGGFAINFVGEEELLVVLPEEIYIERKVKGETKSTLGSDLVSTNACGRIIDVQFSGAIVEYLIEFLDQKIRATRSSGTHKAELCAGAEVMISLPHNISRKVSRE